MRLLRGRTGTLICLALGACTSGARPRPLRLGASLTVQQSGALAVLDSLWTGAPLAVVLGPSGQILGSAARGDLDVVITQAPTLETRLLAGGHALLRCPFVASRFAVLGPESDPARVGTAPTAAEAFGRIARAPAPFVSRGDSSGTHVKELALWQAADVNPAGRPWYIESGDDQPATLRLADERNAYALADLPTFAKLGDLRLRILFSRDTALGNPYTVYVIRTPQPHPAARQFAEWVVGAGREHVLALRLPDGTPAFDVRPGGCAAPPPPPAAGPR